ncbi:MAG TPA: pyridoxal phosphate-dependent aminotransferase [Polyangiaceae bacterium LLY-WYZ-15_(1-7)]|nr:hypothetical protein [Sandaracinus sp.]HJK94111.1 pyridoxal phosphate-dependent aminotransferase [Polyangiaceae bacterium LLY-WYZ-15_(1-7)]MBJ73594.1 hypothetical protein [Sandaracinus sp.]HJL05555.1 pyridoxal phosphate-dependent aminotransferase [Polyangiaceae bacterium LLY-WYZ-15_(1-7)]HJL10765.1 pyridoxal phosphate-dependent aminotransferase [Polyangiaceae bacterium LLY-WYZ-15_(1-7)]
MPLTGVESWLEEQERFDALRQRALAKGGARLADLAYANAWDGPPEAVREALRKAAASEGALDLQYTPYGGQTVARRVAARELAEVTGVPFGFRDVLLTAGAMAALSLLLRMSLPGRVLIPTPTWLDHPLYAAMQRHEPVLVPLADDFSLDVDALRDALATTEELRAVILTCPGNPTGHVFREAELRALAAALEDAGRPLLISDECHRDYLFGGTPFLSPAAFYANTAVVYSYGKRFLVQGQRLGYAALHPDAPEAGARKVLLKRLARAGGYGMPTSLMQRALPDLVKIDPARAAIEARRERTREALEALGLRVVGEATMFLYVEVGDDWAVTEALADRGVLVLPGAIFHHRGWLRLTCSATDAMLARGVEALAEVLA